MSHWTTSGGSRLKAKQNRSFAHRAQMRANVAVPHSMLVPNPHQPLPPPVLRQQQQPTIDRRISGARRRQYHYNPIESKGVRVQIGGLPAFDSQTPEPPHFRQPPPQPQTVRRIRNPTSVRYPQSSRMVPLQGHSMISSRGSSAHAPQHWQSPQPMHVYPPSNRKLPSAPTSGRSPIPPCVGRIQQQLNMSNDEVFDPTGHSWQWSPARPLGAHSHQNVAMDTQDLRTPGRRQAHCIPRPAGISRFQKPKQGVNSWQDDGFAWGEIPMEPRMDEIQSPDQQAQRTGPNILAEEFEVEPPRTAALQQCPANNARYQHLTYDGPQSGNAWMDPAENLDVALKPRPPQHTYEWDAFSEIPSTPRQRPSLAFESTHALSAPRYDSVAAGAPWEHVDDRKAGITRFYQPPTREANVLKDRREAANQPSDSVPRDQAVAASEKWENPGDRNVGIPRFRQQSPNPDASVLTERRDRTNRPLDSLQESPISIAAPVDITIHHSLAGQRREHANASPHIRFFNNGAEVDIHGRPIVTRHDSPAPKRFRAASAVSNISATQLTTGSEHFSDEDLWNQGF